MLRKILLAIAVGLPVFVAPFTAPADDTDIYIDPDTPDQGQPLVMFSIDYRPNLTSTSEAPFGPLYEFFRDDVPDNIDNGPDGRVSDAPQSTKILFDEIRALNNPDAPTTGTTMYFIDTIILTLHYVLQELSDVRIGLMMSHNDAASALSTSTSAPSPPLCNHGNRDLPASANCSGKLRPNRDCDGDGINNLSDSCPTLLNSGEAMPGGDTDGDLCGNSCDNCDSATPDHPSCPGGDCNVANPNQADADGDGKGDLCDFDETQSGDSGFEQTPTESHGGTIIMGFQSLNDDATLTTLTNKLRALKRAQLLAPTQASAPDHPYQGSLLFFEFFRYLTGQRIYNGHNGIFDFEKGSSGATRQNPATNMHCSTGDDAVLATACYDSTIETGGATPSYISPLASAAACSRVFTVNLMFGNSQDATKDANIFTNAVSAGGLGLASAPGQNDMLPSMLSFLRDTDLAENPDADDDSVGEGYGTLPEMAGKQNVTSFFILPDPQDLQVGGPLAQAGGTDQAYELSSNPEALVAVLRKVFQQILSVSTTFVAASVPVNVFNRAEIVDNVYFALFQAQDGGSITSDNGVVVPGGPAIWPGNLKKLKLGTEEGVDQDGNPTTNIVIQDARGEDAIAELDGRIFNDALTYWTDGADPELRTGDINGDGTVEPVALNAVSPVNPVNLTTGRDGRHVSRGAAGQKIPGFRYTEGGPGDANATGKRNLFYISPSNARLTALDVTDTVADQLGPFLRPGGYTAGSAHDPAHPNFTQRHYVKKMLKYIRGQDVNDDDQDTATNDQVNFTTRLEYTAATYTEARNWLMGDPLHSRPLPINYGAATLRNVLGGGGTEVWDRDNPGTRDVDEANPAIFIAIATNDGLLRMIRNTTADGVEDGREIWAFMPYEAMRDQERLLLGEEPGDDEYFHPYTFDGEPTGLIVDRNGNGTIETNVDVDGDGAVEEDEKDRVYLFIGLRRAGRAYYAFDVTNPYDPQFMWRIGNDGRVVAGSTTLLDTTVFTQLGLTFSKPRAGAVLASVGADGTVTGKKLALFFGGGYDGGPPATVRTLDSGDADGDGNTSEVTEVLKTLPGKDARGVAQDDTVGNAIFVVEARTGKLIWKAIGGAATSTSTSVDATTGAGTFVHAGLKDSIPSNLTVIDTNGDGLHDRILVGDTGGNLWRADLGFDGSDADTDFRNDWKLSRLACLGRHGDTDCATHAPPTKTNDRRFFHEPDLVQVRDGANRYDVVVIGSGDRENPLDRVPDDADMDRDEARSTNSQLALNRFYAIRDSYPSVGGGTNVNRRNEELTDLSNSCLAGTSCPTITNGWYINLELANAGDGQKGEKALSAPLTVAGTVFFTTYLPPPRSTANTCGPGEGEGFLYAVSLADASPYQNYDASNPGDHKGDRTLDLNTPGIPAQVVFLGSAAQLGGGGGGGGGGGNEACELNILAGAKIFKAPGCPRFRTFWQRVGS